MSTKSTSTVSGKQVLSYAGARAGQGMMQTYVTMFFMIYLTDVVGISPISAGLLFAVARLWDAVNDPLMGGIVDRTKTKLGKCRPYLIYLTLPMAVSTVLLFWMPLGASATFKLVYIWVAYIIWGMIYTATDIPIWTLSCRMSHHTKDRNKLISYSSTAVTIASTIPALATLALKNGFGAGNDAKGYFLTAIVFCVVSFPLMFQGGLFTREIEPIKKEEPVRLKDSIRAVLGNSQLLLLLLSNVTNVFAALTSAAAIYFTTYVLKNEQLFVLLIVVTMTAATIGTLLVPTLTKRFESKKLFLWISASIIPIGITSFIIGYESQINVFVYAGLVGFLGSITNIIYKTMQANTVEWDERKSGKRNEGVIFSTMTLVSKFKDSISGMILGLILGWIGYVPNVEQTELAKLGIFAMMVLGPVLGKILSIIPIFWFKIDDRTHEKLLEEIEAQGQE